MDTRPPDHPLVRARKKLGLLQVQVADLSGVHIRTLQRYEYGVTTPRRLQLLALARVLDMSYNELRDQIMTWQAAHAPAPIARAS